MDYGHRWNIKTEVELVNNADVVLENLDRVVTSDAAILDKCVSYFNLSKYIMHEYIKDVKLINFNDL